MAVTYILTEDRYTVNGKCCIFYGIAAFDGEKPLLAVRDVSSDKARMEELAQKCTRYGLSPLQLRDVVMDFLEEE